jgi:ParB-like chromosome segregation protein Spo0J
MTDTGATWATSCSPRLDGCAARLAAIAAGDLRVAAQDVARSIRREAKGDRYEALRLGLARMSDNGWITSAEGEQLGVLLDAIREGTNQKYAPDAVVQRVRGTYQSLLEDPQSSPAALAIASAANSLVMPTKPVEGTDGVVLYAIAQFGDAGSQGAFLGGIIGGAIGGALGGGIGAGLGAGLGGAIGGAVGECLEFDGKE